MRPLGLVESPEGYGELSNALNFSSLFSALFRPSRHTVTYVCNTSSPKLNFSGLFRPIFTNNSITVVIKVEELRELDAFKGLDDLNCRDKLGPGFVDLEPEQWSTLSRECNKVPGTLPCLPIASGQIAKSAL